MQSLSRFFFERELDLNLAVALNLAKLWKIFPCFCISMEWPLASSIYGGHSGPISRFYYAIYILCITLFTPALFLYFTEKRKTEKNSQNISSSTNAQFDFCLSDLYSIRFDYSLLHSILIRHFMFNRKTNR